MSGLKGVGGIVVEIVVVQVVMLGLVAIAVAYLGVREESQSIRSSRSEVPPLQTLLHGGEGGGQEGVPEDV